MVRGRDGMAGAGDAGFPRFVVEMLASVPIRV